jgi:D-amino-acid dehydrogenase
MKVDSDVLVIGGGVIGVCSAYCLAKEGFSVSIIEQGEIASGCSGANAGLIVPSFSIPLAAPGALLLWLRWYTLRRL